MINIPMLIPTVGTAISISHLRHVQENFRMFYASHSGNYEILYNVKKKCTVQ